MDAGPQRSACRSWWARLLLASSFIVGGLDFVATGVMAVTAYARIAAGYDPVELVLILLPSPLLVAALVSFFAGHLLDKTSRGIWRLGLLGLLLAAAAVPFWYASIILVSAISNGL